MLKYKKTLISLSVIFILGIAAFLFLSFNKTSSSIGSSNESLDRFYQVKKADLIIGVTLTGTVNARKKHKLACEAAFRTKLVSIVDENSQVKKGDILAEFETEELKQVIDDLKISLENKNKTLEITQKQRDILVSSNKADIEAAENRVIEAQDAFNKYWKLEGPKEKDSAQLNVDNAEQKSREAKASYEKYLDTFNQTVFSDEKEETEAKAKLTSLEKEWKSAEVAYNNALLDQKKFKRYTRPNTITSLKNKLDEAKLNLEKVKITTASTIIQKDNEIFNQKSAIKKIEKDLEKHKGFLSQMKLVAPVDGLVIYGDPDRRWRKIEIEIGMDIRRREVLLTIPDMSELIVDFDIPEQYRSRINVGDKVIITPESMPGLKIDGEVYEIPSLPKSQIHWDPYSPKIYASRIDITEKNSKLVSGMNVKIAIISKVLKNRIIVPIEAVFDKSGKYFVYLKTAGKYKEMPVKIGDSNENFVEIKEGLQPGDVVYLFRPFESGKSK